MSYSLIIEAPGFESLAEKKYTNLGFLFFCAATQELFNCCYDLHMITCILRVSRRCFMSKYQVFKLLQEIHCVDTKYSIISSFYRISKSIMQIKQLEYFWSCQSSLSVTRTQPVTAGSRDGSMHRLDWVRWAWGAGGEQDVRVDVCWRDTHFPTSVRF